MNHNKTDVDAEKKGNARGAYDRVKRLDAAILSDGNLNCGPLKRADVRLHKWLLEKIAAAANPDGTNAFPGIGTLARETGWSERQVSTGIDWLVKRGILLKEFKAVGVGVRRYVNKYRIVWEELERWEADYAIRLQGEQPSISSSHHAISNPDVAVLSSDRAVSDGDPAISDSHPEIRLPTTDDRLYKTEERDRSRRPDAATTTTPSLLEEESDSDKRCSDVQFLDDKALAREIQNIAVAETGTHLRATCVPEVIQVLRSNSVFGFEVFRRAIGTAWRQRDQKRTESKTYFSDDFCLGLKTKLEKAAEEIEYSLKRRACRVAVNELEQDFRVPSDRVFRFLDEDRKRMEDLIFEHELTSVPNIRNLFEPFYAGFDLDRDGEIGALFVDYVTRYFDQAEQASQKADEDAEESRRLAEEEYRRASIARQKAERLTATMERAA